MKKLFVITPKTMFPITTTISFYLLMKHFNASEFAMGVFWACIVAIWSIASILIYKQETVRLEDFVEDTAKKAIKPTLDGIVKQLDELKTILKR